MADFRLAVVGMLIGQQANQPKSPTAKQIAPQRRSPAGITPVETPGEVSKGTETRISQGNFLNLKWYPSYDVPPENFLILYQLIRPRAKTCAHKGGNFAKAR